MIEELETKNLILRKARLDDLDDIYKNVWSDKSLTTYMKWEVTKTYKEAIERLNRTIEYQKNNYAYFVCLKDTNEVIGFAGVNKRTEGFYEETGICLAKKYQNKGYGKELLNVLKKLVFKYLNGERFIYGCFHENEVSKKLCLSEGFKYFTSQGKVREHDNYKYIADFYYFDKSMYK